MDKSLTEIMNLRMKLTKKNVVEAEGETQNCDETEKKKKIVSKYDPPIRFKGREYTIFHSFISWLCCLHKVQRDLDLHKA